MTGSGVKTEKISIDALKSQPLITFAIFAYNQEQFIREAVEGAFSQSYSPLQIILSDDNSNDRTFDIMNELATGYKGLHKVVLNRNEKNLGLADHVNRVVNMSMGEIIVLAAGDDISMPSRSQKSWELLSENTDCPCVSFNTIVFRDKRAREKAQIKNDHKIMRHSIRALINDCDFHINGAARSVRKDVFKQFGPLNSGTPTEDSTTLLRCLFTGAVLESKEPQVFYRVHDGNYYASGNKFSIDYRMIHKQYLDDLEKAIELGMVDSNEINGIKQSLNKRLCKRELRSGFFNSEKKLNYFVFFILFSSSFRLKEKLRFMKTALVTQ